MKDSIKVSVLYIILLAWSKVIVQSLSLSLESVVSSLERHRHKRETPEEKVRNLYKLIPEGCYGSKQLREVFMYSFSKSTHKPVTPKWCTENGFVISDRLNAHGFATTTPPYQIHAYPFQQSKNIFQVVLQSEGSDANIDEAIIVARPLDQRGVASYNNVGRFIKSEGVNLICCSLTDKDVARFLSDGGNKKEAIFYWAANEEATEDFEGNFIFVATVAKSPKEYWINVTSKTMHASSANSRMFGDISSSGQNNSTIDPYQIVEDPDDEQRTTEIDPYQIVEDTDDEQSTMKIDPYQIVEYEEQNDNMPLIKESTLINDIKQDPYQIIEDEK